MQACRPCSEMTGCILIACVFPIGTCPGCARQASRYRALDKLLSCWLYLTLRGIGFTDEVTPADLGGIITAARAVRAAGTVHGHARPRRGRLGRLRAARLARWPADRSPRPVARGHR